MIEREKTPTETTAINALLKISMQTDRATTAERKKEHIHQNMNEMETMLRSILNVAVHIHNIHSLGRL